MNASFNPSQCLSDVKDRINLTSEQLIRDFEMQKIAEYLHYKNSSPRNIGAKNLARMAHVSDSTMKRIRSDVGCPPLHRYLLSSDKHKNKTQSGEATEQKSTSSFLNSPQQLNSCNICSKTFKTPSALKAHSTRMKHTQESEITSALPEASAKGDSQLILPPSDDRNSATGLMNEVNNRMMSRLQQAAQTVRTQSDDESTRQAQADFDRISRLH